MTRFQKAIYRFFLSRGRKVLRELIVTMCAEDSFILSKIRLERVIMRAEKYVAELPFIYFFLFKITLLIVEYGIPPITNKFRRFSSLSLEKRLAYLEEWQGSRFYWKRILFKMISTVCVTHIYAERKLLTNIGFEDSLLHRYQLK